MRPSAPSAILRDGVRSSWAGQRAIQPRALRCAPNARARSAAVPVVGAIMVDSLDHERRLYKISRIFYNCRVSNGAHPCRTSFSSSPGASPKPATAGSNPSPPLPPARSLPRSSPTAARSAPQASTSWSISRWWLSRGCFACLPIPSPAVTGSKLLPTASARSGPTSPRRSRSATSATPRGCRSARENP